MKKLIQLRIEGMGSIDFKMKEDLAKELMKYCMKLSIDSVNDDEPKAEQESTVESTPVEKPTEEDANFEEEYEDYIDYEEPALQRKTYNPFETIPFFQNSRLVAHRCEDCGKITIRRMHLTESNITSCHWCKMEARINYVSRVDIDCPICGVIYYVWTANGLDEIECKDCNAPIDLVYWDNGRKGASSNIALQ